MRRGWQFTGFDPDDNAAEYIDPATGEAYYHRPSWRTPMNDTAEPKRSVTIDMANRFGMEPANFEAVLRATVVPRETTREQFAAFLLIAKRYNLDPIAREIYAFPSRAGGIQPIVGVDGWIKIINDHPQFDGVEFKDHLLDDGNLAAITCRIFRRDRTHPVEVTEYLAECQRPSEAWNRWPSRMLRHKALIQAARYAFGFSGIVEPDEFERFNDDGTMTRKAADTAPIDQKRKMPEKGPYKQEDIIEEPAMAAPKKVRLGTQPNPSTDVATSEAAYQMGREAHAKGAGKLGWPGFWRDQQNIEAWMRGWSAAEDEMTSERTIDEETSRGND
jgi:phage recombination protein Bet